MPGYSPDLRRVRRAVASVHPRPSRATSLRSISRRPGPRDGAVGASRHRRCVRPRPDRRHGRARRPRHRLPTPTVTLAHHHRERARLRHRHAHTRPRRTHRNRPDQLRPRRHNLGLYMSMSIALFQRSTPTEQLPQVLAANGSILVPSVPLGTILGGPSSPPLAHAKHSCSAPSPPAPSSHAIAAGPPSTVTATRRLTIRLTRPPTSAAATAPPRRPLQRATVTSAQPPSRTCRLRVTAGQSWYSSSHGR
jgi:hypothetical protein